MTQAQKTYEKLLGIGTLILVLWHMLMSFGKYFFANYKAELAFAGLLGAAAVIYLLLSLFKWKETRYRIIDFFKKFRTPGQIICILLFVWTILSFLVNGMPHFKDNLWLIFDTGINCLILFNLPMVLSKEKAKKAIEWLLHIVSLFGLAVVLFGLWHLFTLNFITLKTGEIIGMTVYYSFQLGSYYNLTAAITLSFILIAFYMIASQSKLIKILYSISLIPYTLALLLTNSRAGFISCVSAYFLTVFLILWNQQSKRSIPVRLLICIAASAAAAGIIWEMRTWAFQLFETVTHFSSGKLTHLTGISMTAGNHGVPDSSEISQCMVLFSIPVFLSWEKMKEQLTRLQYSLRRSAKISLLTALVLVFCTVTSVVSPMIGSNSNIDYAQTSEKETKTAAQAGEDAVRDLNNMGTIKARERIWQETISIMTSDWRSFLFGTTPIGTLDALKNVNAFHAHNQILQVGICIGVPMMLVFTAFLILIGIKCIPLGLIDGKRISHEAFILPTVFISFIILTLVEAYLFASFSIMSSLFFLFCGWINALDEERRKKGAEKSES